MTPGATQPTPAESTRVGAAGWTIRAWTGSSRYQFSRRAIVQGDSARENPVPVSAAGFELLTRSTASGATTVSLAVDGAEAAGTRLVKPSQSVSAILSKGRVEFIPDDGTTANCDAGKGELRADLADLAFPAAGRIALGASWSDSISIAACISGIPGSAGIARRFEPIGDTTLAGETAIIVQRTDKIGASAVGALDQHSVSLTVDGSAVAHLYVSDLSGKILRVTKVSQVRLVATTAVGTRTFVQNSTSVFQLVR